MDSKRLIDFPFWTIEGLQVQTCQMNQNIDYESTNFDQRHFINSFYSIDSFRQTLESSSRRFYWRFATDFLISWPTYLNFSCSLLLSGKTDYSQNTSCLMLLRCLCIVLGKQEAQSLKTWAERLDWQHTGCSHCVIACFSSHICVPGVNPVWLRSFAIIPDFWVLHCIFTL